MTACAFLLLNMITYCNSVAPIVRTNVPGSKFLHFGVTGQERTSGLLPGNQPYCATSSWLNSIGYNCASIKSKPIINTFIEARLLSIKHTMDVLMPKGFDLTAIEKCMVDYDCNFISFEDDEVINSRIGTNFVTLQDTYFIAHIGDQYAGNVQYKCGYDCRNRVMRDMYPGKRDTFFSFFLEPIDGLSHNFTPPYLLFTNECIRGYESDHNTIIANYTKVDIPQLASITMSKLCNHKFFIVYLGDDQYICCNMQTLETYEYASVIKYRVIEIICGKSDDPFSQLNTEHEELKLIKPLPRFSDFQLKDIEGQPVLENTDYRLEMYDYDVDVLHIHDAELSATYYVNRVDIIIVQCWIVDGVYHLVRKSKYLHVADGKTEMSFTNQIPTKHQRLQFQATERNTFKTVQWNQRNYLTAIGITNYTHLELQAGNDDHLELYLKRL